MLTRRQFISTTGLTLLAAGLPACLAGCAQANTRETGTDAGAAAEAGNASDALAAEGAPVVEEEPARLAAFFFDTVVRIEAHCPQSVLDEAEHRLQRFEDLFSRTKTGSDVYAINHADGMPVRVQPETADLVAKALRCSELSGGLFDLTIGAVSELWDFKGQTVPDPAALEQALAHVDWRTVGLDGDVVTMTDPEARIDLGGIAKGYIADDIATHLRSHGCESALVNLGGNTFALGTKPDGSAWSVGLQDPNQPRGTLLGSTLAANTSIVASGINERSFVREGRTYHHLLDPATGMPAENGMASVTIKSESSLEGDAFSTIAFLLGARNGRAFAEAQGVQALFVATNGNVTKTDGWEVKWA